MKCSNTAVAALVLVLTSSCQAFVPSSTPNARCFSPARLFAAPLAIEGEWSAYLDETNTGLVYYFNGSTGEALWVPPTTTFPQVSLDPSKRVLAQAKQKEYKASTVAVEERPAESSKDEEESGGFGGFFGRKNQEQEASVAVQEEEPAEEKKRRFGFGAVLSAFGGKSKDDEDQVINGGDVATATAPVDEEIIAPVDTSITIDLAAYVLPHPAKVRWGGEDAVFVKGRTFGVFDGVSGAEKLDGVPLYSLTLAKEMQSLVDNKDVLSCNELSLVLTEAAEFADKSATGASTAVVASLSEEGDLCVLNLGDSNCVVIRDGKIVSKTKEIVHYFDCPYQLSEDSPDRPRDGTKLNVKVRKGDIIVMGSDGIFDNLKEEMICDLVTGNKGRAAILTRKIVEKSRTISLDCMADTPYAKLAMRNKDPDYIEGVGGKVDDASCIVVKCA